MTAQELAAARRIVRTGALAMVAVLALALVAIEGTVQTVALIWLAGAGIVVAIVADNGLIRSATTDEETHDEQP